MNHRIWLFACVAAASCAAGHLRAAVVPFDINPDVSAQPAGVIAGGNNIGSPFTYYNIQFTVDGGAADINIRTARADAVGGPGVDQVVSDGFNGSSIITKGDNSFLNTPFAAGELIGDGVNEFQRLPDQFSVLQDAAQTAYDSGTQYLGFRLTSGNYGYVTVNYEPASSTFTFVGGAYETSGAAIAAGAVPEPASAALFGLACAAGAAANRRR